MDYQRGMNRLHDRVDDGVQNELRPIIEALNKNLTLERRFGSTESSRRTTAEHVSDLNRIALDVLGVSFNSLCLEAE